MRTRHILAGFLLGSLLLGPDRVQAEPPDFPRLANVYLHAYVDPLYIPILSQYDLLIVDTIWTEAQLAELKGYNPSIKVYFYICNHCSELDPAPSDAFKVANLAYATTYDLWWYNTSGEPASDWPGSQIINLSAAGYSGPAGTWNEFLAGQIENLVATHPSIDGIFLDNFWKTLSWNQANLQLDSDCNPTHNPAGCDGVADTYLGLDALWNTALVEFATDLRTRLNQLEPGRSAPLALWGNSAADYYTILNGSLSELFPYTSNPDYGNPQNYGWRYQALHPNAGYLPTTYSNDPYRVKVLNATWPGNFWAPYKTEGYEAHKRFCLGSALLGDGYFSFDTGLAGHGQIWWEQEYDHAGLGRGYLGQPAGPAYSVITTPMPDLMTNGGFADLSGWSTAAIGGTGSITLDSSTYVSAPSSVRMNVTSVTQPLGGMKLWRTAPNITQDVGYTISFSARSDVDGDVMLELNSPACPNSECLKAWRISVDSSWKTYETSFIASGTATPSIEFFALIPGSVWLDDIKMEAIDRNAYRRNYTKGAVVVNYTNSDLTEQLGGTYYKLYIPGSDVFDGSAVTSVTVPPQDGMIVVTDPPLPVDVNPDLTTTGGSGNSIRFTLQRSEKVRVDLYDVAGRFVRRLVDDRVLGAGAHTLPWDGLTVDGRRAATGIYFYRVTTPSMTTNQKLLFVR